MKIVFAILSILLYLCAAIFTLLIFPFLLLTFLLTRESTIAESVSKVWLTFILKYVFFSRVTVTGTSNINPSHSYLIFSNHQSFIDIPLLAASIPIRFSWLAKESLFKIPIIGQSMSMAGFIAIRREKKRDAKRSLERVAQALKNGKSVLIFPEGTRSYSNTISPFKRGGASVLAHTTTQILPVTVYGSYNALDPKTFIINFGKRIYVQIHPPIYIDHHLDKKEQIALLERLHLQMTETITSFQKKYNDV